MLQETSYQAWVLPFCLYFQKFSSSDHIGGYKVIFADLNLLFLARFQRFFISRQKLLSEHAGHFMYQKENYIKKGIF